MSKYLVIGAGKSGIAACELLLRTKNDCMLYDGNAELDIEEFRKNNPKLSEIKIIAGELSKEIYESYDIVVLSPGVPTDIPVVNELRNAGLKIIGEIELAYILGKGRVCAITGTNGKTTTTALTGEIMRKYYESVYVVGNIGIPYTEIADETREDSVIVLEVSSFMLETTDAFHPTASAILNITPDHLNRHHTMEAYIEAKENITLRQSKDETVVLNYEDQVLREFGQKIPQHVVFFSSLRKLDNGLYYEDGAIYQAKDGNTEKIINVDELNILGLHNYENAMAAIALTESFGVPMDKIVEGLKTFTAVEHRIEYVCEKRGVRFYNDSKGTNPDAAIKGIQAMDRPTCLIGGGYDKGSTYDEWINAFDGKVKKLVLIGQTREAIADCAEKNGFTDYCFAESLEEAIDICYANAVSGDAVLLSPACASWGMFKNYEVRGEIFKDYVRQLEEDDK